MPKIRADQLLFDLGLAESREQAKRFIMAGLVTLQSSGRDAPVAKPGQQLALDSQLAVRGRQKYVSRGGEKLETALDVWGKAGLDLTGLVVLDAGASTGGFTDCALQHGAVRVYAVDVGHGQLHERLRADPRVVNMEGVNLRLAGAELLPEPVDMLVADVSFISLTLVLPAAIAFLKPGGSAVVLIKPQFELSPSEVGGGVVRDEGLRQKAVDKVVGYCVEALGLAHLGTEPSRLKGPKGNQEYLAWFKRPVVSPAAG